ncbi:MAG: flagellar hook-associated protein FlgK, partial [Rhodobacteraceae bacterium]|nr:flagellar hook-associated protein FlgK [Paracoccaceae bacterium]
MTISGSLASAISGLNAASRNVEVISNNIANAATKGYGRRELVTEARSIGSVGQGVRVVGVRRESDMVLIGDRRMAQAATGGDAVRAAYYRSLESAIGTTDSAVSIGSRIDAFDSALLAAAANPGSSARLDAAVQAAGALTQQISDAADA